MATFIRNKKVRLTYTIVETYEAGIELHGYEVKSLKAGLGSLEGGKVVIRGGEAFMVGTYIPPFQGPNTPGSYDPYRTRRLLLHKKEMTEIVNKEAANSLTTIPISLYSSSNRIKAEVGLCKRNTKTDKRNVLRAKDDKREMRRVKFAQ